MSKALRWIIGIVIVVAIAGIAYAVFHKPSSTPTSSSTSSSSNSSSPPASNSIVLTRTDSSLGQILTDPNGKPLYFYNADSTNKSNCTGSCLSSWPAYTASASSASLPSGITTITRPDNGQVQYVYNGHPLYYFTGDTSTTPTGNGVSNFSVAKPSTASQPNSRSSAQPASSSSSSGYPY